MSIFTAPTLAHYLVLGAILFAISIAGIFINRRNVIIMLMAIELMLLAVNLNFIAFSRYLGDMSGQVFVFFILTVAACEAGIALALFLTLAFTGHAGLWLAILADTGATLLVILNSLRLLTTPAS